MAVTPVGKGSRLRVWLACAVACLASAGAVHAGEPLEFLKETVDRALHVLRDPALRANDKKPQRIQRLREIINPAFDFEEMAKRVLGSHWARRSPAEQQEFVKLFRDFLEWIYSERVDLYSGERVVFGRETVDREFAQVESHLVNDQGERTAVSYRLRRSNARWKVYDAVVEDISIVDNYRSQFNRVISKSSYEGLKKMLQEKVR